MRADFFRVLQLTALAAASAFAQKQDPVSWRLSVEPGAIAPGGKAVAKLTATIESGWHLYSPTTPPGPIPTLIRLKENPAVAGYRVFQPEPEKKFDPNFNSESLSYGREAVFLLPVEISAGAAGDVPLTAEVRYQVCSDKVCLRPVRKSESAKITVSASAAAGAAFAAPAGYTEVPMLPVKPVGSAKPAAPAKTEKPEGLGRFLLVAFGFGLAAIFTPCVFPMIPITMSYFLNQKGSAVRTAATFCLGIVVLFTGMGLAVTALLGPFGVVQLGSNRWVNSFLAAVFVAFGLSLLGAFEITLPSGLLTKLHAASEGGGLIGTLIMGLTFALTAFACVGPFMGTLLAASVQGDKLQPVLGMASFATGLASPFFFLALFPGYLSRMPRSGGWLTRVKVVLGFVVLAAALKYMSNVDEVMHWEVLTRERFLAAWMVLLAMPGLYLLGILRMDGIKAEETVGTARALTGAAFLVLSISLLPGMWGARLGELDAYVPAVKGGAPGAAGEAKLEWMKDDYKGALERARTEGKLVFVNFTGYACTNCKWMKSNMFPRPEVAAALGRFVRVELYTDGTDEASLANQKLQEGKFQTVAIPHYAIVTADERVVASFVGLTKDPKEYVAFLNTQP